MTKTLLVIDDSANIRKIFKLTFEGMYDVMAADNGQTGLEIVRTIVPDLVFVDANMPGMSGYELSRLIKSDDILQCIPVVLMVGTFDTYDEALGLKAKFDLMITKPFETEFIIRTVERELARAEQKINQKLKETNVNETNEIIGATPKADLGPGLEPHRDSQKTKKIHLSDIVIPDDTVNKHSPAEPIAIVRDVKKRRLEKKTVTENNNQAAPWEEAVENEIAHADDSVSADSAMQKTDDAVTDLPAHSIPEPAPGDSVDFSESYEFSTDEADDDRGDQAYSDEQEDDIEGAHPKQEEALPVDMLETPAIESDDLQLLRADSAFAEDEPERAVGVFDSVDGAEEDLLVKADAPYYDSLIMNADETDQTQDSSIYEEAIDEAASRTDELDLISADVTTTERSSAEDTATDDIYGNTASQRHRGEKTIVDNVLEKDDIESGPFIKPGPAYEIGMEKQSFIPDSPLTDTLTLHPGQEEDSASSEHDSGPSHETRAARLPDTPRVDVVFTDDNVVASMKENTTSSDFTNIPHDILDSLIDQAVARFWTQRGHELADLVADRVYAKIVKRLMGRLSEVFKEQEKPLS